MLENPFKIKTAVMVNRDHSLFPVKINFSGLNLSTSVNEHVDVEFNKDEEFTAVSYTHLRAHETPEHLLMRVKG